jgi:hypothetical protein
MSIDAKVRAVIDNEDGSGKLVLVRRGDSGPGQTELHYDSAPYENTALNGLEIWGDAQSIMLGDMKIANRIGYTKIKFLDDETFKRAVKAYHKSHT